MLPWKWDRDTRFSVLVLMGLVAVLALSIAFSLIALQADVLHRVYLEGRSYKENGHPIQANWYTEPAHREAFQQGWREAEVVDR